MSVHEVIIGYQWLLSTLSNDDALSTWATGGIWRNMAPPGTQPPYVIMAFQGGHDVITANAFRILNDLVFQVKAVGPASMTDVLAAIAARIDELIGSPPAAGTVPGGVVLSSNRESPLALDELVNGSHYSNLGGLYRLQIEQIYS